MKLFRRLDIIIIFWLYILQHVHSTCLSSLDEDIVFVLDSSWSIWRSQWPGILDFVASLVSQSLPQGTRVGAVVYGSAVATSFGLEQYSTFDEIAAAIKDIDKLGGITKTKLALEEAYSVFEAAWDVTRARKLVLLTDGEPSDYPCQIAPTLKSGGIKVITIVVGDWYEETNMDCLVNDADQDVIPFGSFTQMQNSLGTVEEVLCSIDYDINVIEVQAYSDSPRFIEIYNMGASVDVYGLQLSGMYSGTIWSSTTVPQGDILLISDDESLAADCASNCVFYHWTGNTQSYVEPADDGTINEGFSIVIYDASGSDIHSVMWTDNAGFPNVANGRSFELLLSMSNNNLGSNWRSSCYTGGTPGELPGDECPGCENDSECKFQGDQNATCITASRTCRCADSGYYIQGSTCEPLPAPSNCVAQASPGYDNRYKFDWIQPDFVDSLAFMRIEITFTLSGSYTENMLEILSAPPTSVFAIEDEYIDDVRITAVFNKTDVSYWTEDLYCVVQNVPTVSPSETPSKTPTEVPSHSPIVSPVPEVESCELRIAETTKTEAKISWVWNGEYEVGGVKADPTAFVLKWGESATNYFSYVESSARDYEISLVASWDYSRVVATVTVQGFEGGAVLSQSVDCSVMQATPSPVAYPVPAPDACTLDINVGGEIGIVTITAPDNYTVSDNNIVNLGYLVRIVTNSYTDYNLGFEGNKERSVIIPSSTYDVYAVSLGTEGDKHPESDQTECDVVTPQPTPYPTVAVTKYEVPTLSSCEVLVESIDSLDNFLVKISWVKGSQYTHDGISENLKGYKYKLGGMSEWRDVDGDATSSKTVLWSASYAAFELITYMIAVGWEENNDGVIEYPDSSSIPCDLVTKDPTIFPTSKPSKYPTNYPSSKPTGSPTFELPEIGFVATNAITGSILYNCMEGDAGIEIQLWQWPVSLYPMKVSWEIVDNNGVPVVDIFNETSGTVSFEEYRTNYKSESPSCSEPDGTCIPEYVCLSHAGYDYCVKDVGTVYEKIYLTANDDEISNEDPEYFYLVLRTSEFYSSNVFYENSSQIIINSQSSNATIKLFDAASQAFCLVSPGSLACLGGQQFALEWWHWMIIIALILLLIMAVVFYRYQSTAAERALRDQKLAEEAWDNEVLIGEEGWGPGTSTHRNPLALSVIPRKETFRATPTMPEGEEGEDDGEDRVEMTRAFEIKKSQFLPTESKKKEHRTLQPVLRPDDNIEEVLGINVISD